jgi:hypothetical protein
VSRMNVTVTMISESNLRDLLHSVTDWFDRRAGPVSEVKTIRFEEKNGVVYALITEQEEA